MAISFFSDLGNTISQQAGGLAVSLSTSLGQVIVPLFVSATALTVFFHGLAVIRGESQQPFMSLLWKVFKVGVIIAVIDAYTYPDIGVIQAVTAVQQGLVQTITGAINSSGQCTGNAFQVIDCASTPIIGFFAGLVIFGMSLITDGSMSNVTIGLMVFCFILIGGGVLALALFYALLSTLGMAIVLGLGPLFIAALAFGPTAKYFDSWLSSIFNFALLGAISSVVLSFISATQWSYLGSVFPNLILGLIEMTIMGFVFLMFMLEVPRLVSHLTSGADVTGGVVGFAQIRGVYGAPWFGGASGGASLAQRAGAAARLGR